jgi:hypothetical protein
VAGDQTLAIFSYPAPAMARQQASKFQGITGATVKRTGSLVALALAPSGQPADTAAAERLLAQINYAGVVQSNETPPLELKPESAGKMLIAIINLAGFVLGLCVAAGLMVAAALFLARRRFGYSGAEGTLISLHLSGK